MAELSSTRVLAKWRRAAAELLFPATCPLCGRDTAGPGHASLFCGDCLTGLCPARGPVCTRCAMPCPEYEATLGHCVHCREAKFRFDAACTLGPYDGDLRQVVLKIKHDQFESLAHHAAELLAAKVQDTSPAPPIDLVTCVPMHWFRRWLRGASAAETLGKRMAAELRLPYFPDLVRCQRLLPKQHTLTPPQRRKNVRRGYRVSRGFDIAGTHVLLVDDVLTTGATADQIAKLLRRAGASRITVAALARGTGA